MSLGKPCSSWRAGPHPSVQESSSVELTVPQKPLDLISPPSRAHCMFTGTAEATAGAGKPPPALGRLSAKHSRGGLGWEEVSALC